MVDIAGIILTAINYIGSFVTMFFQLVFGVTLPTTFNTVFGGLILASLFYIGIALFRQVFKYILYAGWIFTVIAAVIFVITELV
ncbi:MAG: hypothetical protein ACTSV7_09220 [Candidatus Baldrarchaeia archaeon]